MSWKGTRKMRRGDNVKKKKRILCPPDAQLMDEKQCGPVGWRIQEKKGKEAELSRSTGSSCLLEESREEACPVAGTHV